MTAALLVLLTLSGAGPVLDVRPIPLGDPNAQVFLVPLGPEGAGGVCVQEGRRLAFYRSESGQARPWRCTLPEGTSVFDVNDLDGDGAAELLFVCGPRIVRVRLLEGAGAQEELFSLETQLSQPSRDPLPWVLVVEQAGRNLLALPTEDGLELRQQDGTIQTRYPIGRETTFDCYTGGGSWDGPGVYEASASWSTQASIELHIHSDQLDASHTLGRRGTSRQLWTVADQDPADWPWFPVRPKAGDEKRALYATHADSETLHMDADTLIRIRELRPVKAGGSGAAQRGDEEAVGPLRRYPGLPALPPNDLPDFNGDGYTDLILWTSPMPSASVGSLTRAASSGAWPVRLTVYLFSVEKNRFDPKPAARVEVRVPVMWFLAMEQAVPLRNLALRDFNGDGRTDLGVSTSSEEFSVWLYYARGFSAKPNETHRFPEPLSDTAFKADLNRDGRTHIGLRGERAVYVLRPNGAGRR